MDKREDEDASRAADPALEQGRTAGEAPAGESDAEPDKDGDEVDEASEDSFPTSDAPSW
jgi:hypothetical protein